MTTPRIEEIKVCTKCKEPKALCEFSKMSANPDGLRSQCKSCSAIYRKENPEKIAQHKRKYRQNNKEKESAYWKKYRQENKEKIATYLKKYEQERRQNDPVFKLINNLRNRVGRVIKGKNKSASTTILLGCHPDQAREHIESQFVDGMSWDNYGEWHVDHITPCAVFNMEDKEHQRQCFHYTNLQPLLAKDNLSKSYSVEKWEHTYDACITRINEANLK